jgi:hypothetical protein
MYNAYQSTCHKKDHDTITTEKPIITAVGLLLQYPRLGTDEAAAAVVSEYRK